MTRREHWRYEMLLRLRDFGRTHRDLFSDAAGAVTAFSALDQAIIDIDRDSEPTLSVGEERRLSRRKTRHELRRRVLAIKRTAVAWDKAEPGAGSRFSLPRTRTDYELGITAKVFAANAEERKPAFLERGMPDTFVDDLRQATDLFLRVRGETRDAWFNRVLHRELRQRGLQKGLETAQLLDVIVANVCVGDPVRLAAWKEARRVPRPSSQRRSHEDTKDTKIHS